MARGCLYCGLQLPEAAEFCPACGRPLEDVIRVESGVKIERTQMAKGCLECSLPLPGTAEFCPACGRLLETGFAIRPIRPPELDGLRKETKRKEDLRRQQEFSFELSGPGTRMEDYAHPGNCPKSGACLTRPGCNTTASVEKIESIAKEKVEEYSLA